MRNEASDSIPSNNQNKFESNINLFWDFCFDPATYWHYTEAVEKWQCRGSSGLVFVSGESMNSDRIGEAIRDQQLRITAADLEQRIRAGEQITAQDLLNSHPELVEDDESAVELIYTEFVTLEDVGQAHSPEEFLARYPRWQHRLSRLLEIHFAFETQGLDSGMTQEIHVADTTSSDDVPCEGDQNQVTNQVLGSYHLDEEIARGGMGIVYRARQKTLNRIVAIKLIRSDATLSQRSRFRAEAEAVAILQHPNIVQIFEIGLHDDIEFIAMEYVSGRTLEQFLQADKYSIHDAAQLLHTVARTMEYAHNHGVVHRDLKPGNILLRDDGEVKVADFGLAKRLLIDDQLQTQSGAILGTPCYMSPEQASGKNEETGPQTDVYSIGTILYELITGRPPFLEGSPLETLEQIRSVPPVNPRKLVRQLPQDLETICLKCLEKKPAERYQSCGELADELHRFLNHEPIRTRPPGLIGRAIRWSRRRPVVARLSGALVVMVTAFLLIFFQQRDRERHFSETIQNISADARTTQQKAIENEQRAERASAAAELASSVADANFRKVRDLVKNWTHLGMELGRQPGMGLTAEQTLSRALEHYESFLAEHEDDEEIRRAAAGAYYQAGCLQLKLGWLNKAEQTLQRAVDLYQRVSDGNSKQYAVAVSYRHLGHAYRDQSKWEQGEQAYQKSMEILDRLIRDFPTKSRYRFDYANTLVNLCIILTTTGRRDESEALYEEAIDLQLSTIVSFAKKVAPLNEAIDAIGVAHVDISDQILAVRKLRELLVSKNHESLSRLATNGYFAELALCIDDVGSLLQSTNRLESAADAYHEGLALRQLVMPYVGDSEGDIYLLARSYKNLGHLESSANNFEGAIENYVTAISWLEPLTKRFPNRMDFCRELGSCLLYVGKSQLDIGQFDDSLQNYSRAVTVFENGVKLAPTDQRLRRGFATANNDLAWHLIMHENSDFWDPPTAIQRSKKAVELFPESHAYLNTLGTAHYRTGQFESAKETLLRSIESSNGGVVHDWYFLAMTYVRLGDKQSAQSWYEKAQRWTESHAPLNPEVSLIKVEATELIEQ